MEKNNFWNDAAKFGAILGGLLAVSSVFEYWMLLSGKAAFFMLFGLEWLVVAGVHYYLLHRYTRRHSMLYTAQEGFTFGQGYGYLLIVSAFAGVIVGLVQFLYLHVVVDYSVYMDKYIASMQNVLALNGGVPASMEPFFVRMFSDLQSAPMPTVLSTIANGIFVSVLFGALFGLIIAGVLSRAPKPFDTENNE